MKIKTKKQLNLPQLIEWAWENDKRDLSFRGHDKEGSVVSISINENEEFTSDWHISKDQIFTVEVEEEITEDTVIPELVELYGGLIDEVEMLIHRDKSISEAKDTDECPSVCFYILKDDSTMSLIWKEGKLVE